MDRVQALKQFWGSFGVEAYDETDVPDDAQYPYITYNSATDSLGGVVPLHADLWFYDASWYSITKLSEAIAKRIKEHGSITIPFDDGYIYMAGGTPFAQRVDDPEQDMKRIYINVQAEYLCAY